MRPTGIPSRAVPVRAAVCGLPVALSTMLTDAEREPNKVGLKETVIVQEALTANVAPVGQLLLCAKSPEFVPVNPIDVRPSGAVPLFVKTIGCVGLVVPTSCAANVRLPGFSVTAGAVPVPLKGSA